MGNQGCFQSQDKQKQFKLRQLKIVDNAPKSNYASRVNSFPRLSENMQKLKQKLQISDIDQYVKDCPIYYIFEKKSFYQGQWSKGLPHGYGNILYADKSYYSGFILNGEPNTGENKLEQAIYIFNNDDYYLGQFKNSLFNGKGKLVAENGAFSYIGQFIDGVPHGKGLQNHITAKQTYEGNYLNGVKSGQGKYFINGILVYVGDFKEGNFNGQGRLIDYDGSQFVGEFLNGKKVKGQYISSKATYQGQFQNQKINGMGTYEWQDGKMYQGNFKAGKFDGVGKIYHPNGKIIQGIWKNGKNVQITNTYQKKIEQMEEIKKNIKRRSTYSKSINNLWGTGWQQEENIGISN